MILPDTSAWVEEIRHTGSAIDRTLESLLRSEAEVGVTEPVVMELLAGARDKRELRATRKRMLAFPMLRVDNLVTYERAAVISRLCRAAGEPVRNTMDCLIAAVAIREGATILHADRDFDAMARHAGLRVEPIGQAP